MKTLRGVILQKKSTTVRNNPVIIISPLPGSDYAALVNVLDEMIITGIQHYAIVDIDEDDTRALQLK